MYVGVFKGVIILIDELEEAFSGLTSTSQAQYAQDLRNLFDSHPNGIVFVVAAAPIAERLQQISPALQRRLGEGTHITPISNEEMALEYARAYIHWGRNEYKKKMNREVCLPDNWQNVDEPYYPLTKTKVKEVYNRLKDTYGPEKCHSGYPASRTKPSALSTCV